MPPLEDFQSLRVLDILGNFKSWENKHIRNIGSFYQLRYLRIQSLGGITELPEDIGKLQNLETLDLRECEIKKLPSTTARLQNLVRLFVRYDCVLSADMFGSMRALEEISNINTIDNPEKLLEEFGHLTKLRKITVNGSWIGSYREKLTSFLKGLGNDRLQYLSTHGPIGEYLFSDSCCTFPHLQNLILQSSMMRVPKGMASLTNILQLNIAVNLFDDEGLRILMGMPYLANLKLEVWESSAMVTVSRNGFKLLEVFHYRISVPETTGIKFAAGAMPALRWLHLCWFANYVPFRTSDGADMGFEHLLSLAELEVEIDCLDATLDEVETVEGIVEKAIALHPNPHTLQLRLSRTCEDYIITNEEREEEEEELLEEL